MNLKRAWAAEFFELYYIITQNFSLSGKEFVMKTNMGSVDRIIRIILAVRPDFSERRWVGNWHQPV